MKKRQRKKISYKTYILLISVFFFSIITHIYKNVILTYINTSIDTTLRFLCFSIDEININGCSQRVKKLITKELGISKNDIIFKLTKEQIQKNIEKVSWVTSCYVKKILPNIIDIHITEAEPIAIFQEEGKNWLIDKSGKKLETVIGRYNDLPIISGSKSNITIFKMLKTISAFPEINKNIETMTYIRERRWDLNISGIKIKLPEEDVDKSLYIVDLLLKNKKITKEKFTQIDLRNHENVVFKPH